jgi:hypothetical protein
MGGGWWFGRVRAIGEVLRDFALQGPLLMNHFGQLAERLPGV